MTFNDFQDKITPAVSGIAVIISRHYPKLTETIATESRNITKSRFIRTSS